MDENTSWRNSVLSGQMSTIHRRAMICKCLQQQQKNTMKTESDQKRYSVSRQSPASRPISTSTQ
jgi:hypothetical protein